MKLILSNGTIIDLILNNSLLSLQYQKIYKNLSHVPVPFRPWDNPHYIDMDYEQLVDNLTFYASQVSVKIDRELCLSRDQTYFNAVHKIYEENYNGDPRWLDFHEHIHLCEFHGQAKNNALHIDYREKAGLLEKPFDPQWFSESSTKITAGTMYVAWAELGKTPYSYWQNNEPDNLDRMCALAKPWRKLRPKIIIALDNIDTLSNKKVEEFEAWWKNYSDQWCEHWNLSSWTVHEMHSVSVLGHTPDLDLLISELKNKNFPVRVTL
jgi:hypothetical protein